MFFKSVCVATIFTLVLAKPQHHTAMQFPAGVNPHDCPNYPICDNLHLHKAHSMQMQSHWQPHAGMPWQSPAPVWQEQHSWNPEPAHHQQQQQYHGGWQGGHGQQQHGGWHGGHGQQQNGGWHDGGHGQQQHGGWQGGYNQQQQHGWHATATAADKTGGDKFPAGVNPQMCPNYPYCDVNMGSGHSHGHGHGHGHGHMAAQPLPGWSERMYPAGVSAHDCPNFPFCH